MKKLFLFLLTTSCVVGILTSAYADYEGTIGTGFTINGSGFGNSKSKVYLLNGNQKVQAKVENWSDSSITCLWTKKISPGTYSLYVQPKGKGMSPIPVDSFTIMQPIIDQVTPDDGVAGDVITVNGRYFTNKKPKVYFEKPATHKRKRCKVLSSSMDPETGSSNIKFIIPKWGLDKYNLILINAIGQVIVEFASCSYNMSPPSQTFDASGGTGKINVTAESGCSWTAISNDQWITITAEEHSAEGGDGYVNYSVSSNPETIIRNGYITVAGKTFTITQEGAAALDTTPPTVIGFSIPSTSTSLTVSIISFTATDEVGVTGYMVTETSSKPSAGAAGWSASAPTSYPFASAGVKTLYAWAKDAAGNVSESQSASVTITINLPKTGQTISYYAGDDGELQIGVVWPVPRFIVSGDCVTDNLTGLMWAKNANLAGEMTWQSALDYVASMNSGAGLCGYNDWRLPNIKELRSLVDYTQYNPPLPVDNPFVNLYWAYYWSSTTCMGPTDYAWVIVTWSGRVEDLGKGHGSGPVWPVRAESNLSKTGQTKCFNTSGTEISCTGTGQDGEIRAGVAWPNPRFTVSGDCVTDNLTGLIWAKNANLPKGPKEWQQALDYIASINSGAGLCGHYDWRLPNVNELESLVNAGKEVSEIEEKWLNGQGFINVQSTRYWTSTTMAEQTVDAWLVNMYDGDVRGRYKSDIELFAYYVWPVRAGQ
ncbi:MAG: DUF1566 domain-containing protein [Thermodesulfovibrionales bacterium]